jgi:hypothetical protein
VLYGQLVPALLHVDLVLQPRSRIHITGLRHTLPATHTCAWHCHLHRPKAISLLHVLEDTQCQHCIWHLHSPSPAHCTSALRQNEHAASTTLTIDDCAWHRRARSSSRRLCTDTEVHFRARMRVQPCPGRTTHTWSCSLVNARCCALPATHTRARHCHSHPPKAISLLHVLEERVVLVHSRPNHGFASYSTKNHYFDDITISRDRPSNSVHTARGRRHINITVL